jgi:hypothetical protein
VPAWMTKHVPQQSVGDYLYKKHTMFVCIVHICIEMLAIITMRWGKESFSFFSYLFIYLFIYSFGISSH